MGLESYKSALSIKGGLGKDLTLLPGGLSVPKVNLLTRRVVALCALIYFVAQIFFLAYIQFPKGRNFDEFHYVPSAKQFLELKPNQNYEHPPLAKELIAVGIAVGGDRPFGWRLMSTVFGALTLVGMFLWGLAVFEKEEAAWLVTALTAVNQLLYVQARIGMLDTFMFAFLAWALAAFAGAWKVGQAPGTTQKLLYFSGAMFGLATACKWFAVLPWLACGGLVLGVRLLQRWGTRFDTREQPESESDWYHPQLWKDVPLRTWLIGLIAIPIACYYFTFIPYFFIPGMHFGVTDWLFTYQKNMYEGQLRVVGSHPYQSTWTSWALMLRPIWYAFDKEGPHPETVRGVILLGNPLIMWGGLWAILMCLWGWIEERRREAFLILFTYAVFYLSWAVVPRKVAFYYYYYPAGMTLSLALAYALMRPELRNLKWLRWSVVAACLGIFVYFFPILGAVRIPAETFRKWMWLQSWI